MTLKTTDPEIYGIIEKEEESQRRTLKLIPSENYVSKEVREAVGSVFMNKYSEGLPGKRYYQGNENVDALERLVIQRAKDLFGVPHVNVQPYSGSPANSAVYFALLAPGDTLMGLALASGGHLTHGHPQVTFSGKYFKSVQYEVEENGLIDYDKVEKLAQETHPGLIVAGATAYPRILDYPRFAEIAQKVGAYLMVDMSHWAGLVAGGVYPSPVTYADIVTTTTHKTLRGPRGAMAMVTEKGLAKDPELGVKIDKAVFPGLQGGPHNHTIAGIGVCLQEAAQPEFRAYAQKVVENAHTFGTALTKRGYNLVTGGTDTHLLLVDLRNKGLDGWCAAWALEYAGIICNRNTVPGETGSAFYPSGIRLGTAAVTTQGLGTAEMLTIAKYIDETLNEAAAILPSELGDENHEKSKEARKTFKRLTEGNQKIIGIRQKVSNLCQAFPLP